MNSVISKARKLVIPSRGESARFNRFVSEVASMLVNAFSSSGLNVEVVVGGSFSRDTWLPGAHDADLFIRFMDEHDLKSFSKVITAVFPKAVRIKGSRDYFKINYNGFEFEFIPVLKINSPLDAKNSMDASFFHIDYVRSRLVNTLPLEVRLLKLFSKVHGVYGAESYVSGFSGYVLELLIIHYKSFKRVVKAVAGFKQGAFIDLMKYYDSKSSACKALGFKAECPLIIIDPVNPLRNAARSVSYHSFSKLVFAARRFLDKPGISFFKIPVMTKDSLQRLASKRGHFIFFKKFAPTLRKDAFFSKLLHELKKVAGILESLDFFVYDYGFLESGLVYFEVVNSILPSVKRVVGPSVYIDGHNLKRFLSKKRRVIHGPYIMDGRVCFDVKREAVHVKPLLMKLLADISFS